MKWKNVCSLAVAATMFVGCSAPTTGETSDGEDGSSVVVQIDADLNTMDHQIATDASSFIMQTMCFSGLTSLDENGQPVSELAKSWDVSEDGKTYTFHLDENAQWSDGTPVTADDFVFAWQRLDDPETASEYAFILDTIHVKNAAEVNAGEMDVSELGVRAIDEHTFEVQLELPCEFMLGLLAFPSFFPLNRAFYESHVDSYAQSPEDMLYCGPYDMSSWEQGSEYTFEKNEDYFNTDDDSVDEVTFKFIQDTQSALLAYEQGDIDVVNLQSEQVDQYKKDPGFNQRLTGYLWYLSVNFHDETMQNENLRAAIAYGIDRKTIAEEVLKDGSVAAEGLVPRDFAFSSSGVDFRDEAGVLSTYDPDLAEEYYEKAKAELGGDVTVELLFEDSEASKAVAENIQAQLQSSCPGLTINLNSKPKKTRLEMMRTQEYQIGLTMWGPDYADPQTFLDLFDTENNAGYSNPDYDALVKSANYGEDASDPEKRWADYLEAEKIILTEDYGIIPVYQKGGALVINPQFTGIAFHNGGVDDYRHIHAV